MGLWFISTEFLYVMWYKAPVFIFFILYGSKTVPVLNAEKLLPRVTVHTCDDHMTVDMWVYFQTLNFIPLICILALMSKDTLSYYSFEIRNFNFAFHFHSCFGDSWSLEIPYALRICHKKPTVIFIWIALIPKPNLKSSSLQFHIWSMNVEWFEFIQVFNFFQSPL